MTICAVKSPEAFTVMYKEPRIGDSLLPVVHADPQTPLIVHPIHAEIFEEQAGQVNLVLRDLLRLHRSRRSPNYAAEVRDATARADTWRTFDITPAQLENRGLNLCFAGLTYRQVYERVRRNLTDYGVRLDIPQQGEEEEVLTPARERESRERESRAREEDAMRKADEEVRSLAASIRSVDAKHEELRAKEAVLDSLLRDADAIREGLRKEASMKQMRVELRERVLAKKTQMQQGRGRGLGLAVM